MMEYKGYVAKVDYDSDANLLHGYVINTRDVITFQATTVDGIRQEFEASIEDYLDFCAQRKEKPERPFSGRFVVRMDPKLHRDLTICAAREGVSINSWIVDKISKCVADQSSPHRAELKKSWHESGYHVVERSLDPHQGEGIGWLEKGEPVLWGYGPSRSFRTNPVRSLDWFGEGGKIPRLPGESHGF